LFTVLNKKNPSKLNFINYKYLLSGVIEYESPSPDLEIFNGSLKLIKDPKVCPLNIDNLVLRGSILRTSGWFQLLII